MTVALSVPLRPVIDGDGECFVEVVAGGMEVEAANRWAPDGILSVGAHCRVEEQCRALGGGEYVCAGGVCAVQ